MHGCPSLGIPTTRRDGARCSRSRQVSESNSRKVVVTQRFFDPETIVYLRSHDCEVVIADLPPGQADGDVPRETLLKWLNGAAGWIVGHARVTRDLLRELPE